MLDLRVVANNAGKKLSIMKYSEKSSFSLFIFMFLFFIIAANIPAQEDTARVRELIKSAQEKGKPFTEVLKITEEAIILSEKIDYLQGKADALNINGNAYLKLGEYPEAVNDFLEELKLREKNPGWVNSSVGNTYTMIGESYRAVANFDVAVEYLNKALKINLEKIDEKEIAHTYNRLAAVYYEISFRREDVSAGDKAEDFANKSIEISEKINEIDLTISSYNILGSVNSQRKDFDNALKYYFLALGKADKDSAYADRPNILNNISNVYLITGNYSKSIEYGLQSYELSKKSGIKVYIIVSARALSDAYSKTGDYKSSFNYLLEAQTLYIELYDERKSAEIYGLQKKHENELAVQTENARTMRRITFGIALIIVVIIISVVIFMRHKQQVLLNLELENKNKLILSQKEELAQSNAAKDKFFSILSHDIRNPLNGMLGFSNILDSEYDELNENEKREYIGYLKTSSESLYKLIDKVLIWSRLQAKRIEISDEKINLYETVLHAIELQKANSLRKGIVLENNIPGSINITADKNMIDTIIRNLIDNAVKFTGNGGRVLVSSEVKNRNVKISVSDTGIGMSNADLERLFQIDSKNSSLGTEGEEGSGLGLVLCKEMLELMNSSLIVESEKGKGSKFTFTAALI
jgi:signal transduction histidine kinase